MRRFYRAIQQKIRRSKSSKYSKRNSFTIEPLENRLLLSVLTDLRITEIMYNPSDNALAEYIELKNIGDSKTFTKP